MEFDDQKQTIMGKNIADLGTYQAVRDALLFNYFEGWQPNSDDRDLVQASFDQPQTSTIAYLRGIFGKEFGHE